MRAVVERGELFYETLGEGMPLILLHGGLGFDHTCFRPWLDPLGDQLKLVFVDQRGSGRSSRPERYDDIDHETWANDVEALRKHLGAEQFLLLGHSYGSFIAQEYAVRFADRLAGLILCAAAPRVDYPDVIMANLMKRGTPEQVQEIGRAMSQPFPDDAALKKNFEQTLAVSFQRFDPAIGARMTEETRFCAATFNHCMGQCLPKFDVLSKLPSVHVPTLALTGRHDWVAPPAQAERIAGIMPNARVHIFEESSHYPFIEERDRFLDVVGSWIGSLR